MLLPFRGLSDAGQKVIAFKKKKEHCENYWSKSFALPDFSYVYKKEVEPDLLNSIKLSTAMLFTMDNRITIAMIWFKLSQRTFSTETFNFYINVTSCNASLEKLWCRRCTQINWDKINDNIGTIVTDSLWSTYLLLLSVENFPTKTKNIAKASVQEVCFITVESPWKFKRLRIFSSFCIFLDIYTKYKEMSLS